MVARDDSVIRGSLIAALIFLVLSIALNFFLWRWGDTQAGSAATAQERLASTQNDLQTKDDQTRMMKAMLGVGGLTEAEFDLLSQSASGDPEMENIERNFVRDMAYFGSEVEVLNRNYPALPEFLMTAIRSRNEQYGQARDEATQVRTQADSDVANARTAEQAAKTNEDQAVKKLENERSLFTEDREKMKMTTEETRDNLTKTVQEFNQYRKLKTDETTKLKRDSDRLTGTIQTQKLQLNQLRNDQFETTQGEIRYVVRGGNVVTINLGSADNLRPGITFGVIDGDETRLQDAKVKATIQVTKIVGTHLAQARVVAFPEVKTPIIPGDMIYSPFWAPGRKVKIALAGDIDIDDDQRPDNEAIKGMITSAGAEVTAEVSSGGVIEGTLDASIRFLVIGTTNEDDLAAATGMGDIKAKARELGLTIIPAWKLQAYLKTIDDTLTTPLGSAVRGRDFPPDKVPATNSRLPTDLPDMYKRDTSKLQKDNKILSP